MARPTGPAVGRPEGQLRPGHPRLQIANRDLTQINTNGTMAV